MKLKYAALLAAGAMTPVQANVDKPCVLAIYKGALRIEADEKGRPCARVPYRVMDNDGIKEIRIGLHVRNSLVGDYEKTIFVIPEKPGAYPAATEGEMRITNVDKNTEFYTYFRIEDGKKHRYSRKGHYRFYTKNRGKIRLA